MCHNEYLYKLCEHRILEEQPGGCDCVEDPDPYICLQLCPPCFEKHRVASAPIVIPIDVTGEGRRFAPREHDANFVRQMGPLDGANDSIGSSEGIVMNDMSSNGGERDSNSDGYRSYAEEGDDEEEDEDPIQIAVDVCRGVRDPFEHEQMDNQPNAVVKRWWLKRWWGRIKRKVKHMYE